MPDLSGLQHALEGPARRLLKRLVAPRPRGGEPDPGPAVTADGAHAVAVTEAWVSDAAALGPSHPTGPALQAFAQETAEEPLNLLGRPAAAVASASPRGALACASGLAEAGRRASVFLSGDDLAGAQDLLARAAERRLPLVVHLASSVGSDHTPFHGASGSGAVRLFAADAQEAVDFTLVGHRLAEEALVPVLVAMDGPETALCVQDLHLPSPSLVRRYLGDPGERVHPSSAAQELLYGRHRRRLPKGHDPERPLLAGPLRGPEARALAAAGRRAYLEAGVAERLDAAFERFAAVTGRRHGVLSTHRTEGLTSAARLIFVAMGSAVGTAEAAADRLREEGLTSALKVGVVGLRSLSPLPAARLAEELAGARTVVVLERSEAPLAEEGPLTARVRSALSSLGERKAPRLATAFYGLGGTPLAAGDLTALARELSAKGSKESWRSPVWLGVDFAPEEVADPKRQVVLDALAREYPEAARLGLKGMENGKKKKKDQVGRKAKNGDQDEALDLRPEGAVTVGLPGEGHLMEELAAVVHRALDVHLRGRREPGSPSHLSTRAVLTWAPETFGEPGSAVPADLRLVSLRTLTAHSATGGREPWQPLASGGALLVDGARGLEGEELWKMLSPALVRQAAGGELRLFSCPRYGTDEGGADGASLERLLGSVLGALEARGEIAASHRKLLDARREILGRAGLPDGELDRRMDAFTAGLDGVREVEAPAETLATGAGPLLPEPQVPAEVRRLARNDSELDSLPRFWDQVGVLYRRGEESELVPDPYLAAGAVPPLSAAFRSFAPGRDMLPAFDPGACTGCGACWSVCPHGALDPLALGPEDLIGAGMERAKAAGATVDTLRMAKSRLAKALSAELGASEGGELGPTLDRAFETATAKMPLSEERKASLGEAFAAVREQLARLPVARTEPFFDSDDAGELFSLAVDADACRACGLCVEVCEPEALTAVADSPGRTAGARELSALVDDLPAPSEETVERVRRHPEVGPVAGSLLDREARRTVAPCEGAEPGAGDALALRQILASAARHLAPGRRRRLEELEELQEQLAAAIHRGMAHALPEKDLSALALGLDAVERPEADLGEIISRVEGAFDDERVDVSRLRRLVAVAREVADLRQHIAGGPFEGRGDAGAGRPGRSPFGLVLGPGPTQDWAATFPWNPFAVPVTADTVGETAELARGLAAGRLQETLEEARLLARARQELESPAASRPASARRRGEVPGPRRVEDLSPEDLRSCPPVLAVVSEGAATSRGLAGLLDLLSTDLPVKLVVLSEARLPGLGPTAAATGVDLGLLALTRGSRAVVAQTSPAEPDHLERSLEAALEGPGPALLRVHAPSPARHGFAPERTRERLEAAVAARVLPLYLSRPGDEGGRSFDLSANPEPEAAWADGSTPAHFALGEDRTRGELEPWPEDGSGGMALTGWLALPAEEREGETPTLEAEGRTWAISPALGRAAAECAATWESLRHLARRGVAEAGQEGVDAEELEALEARHREELGQLTAHHEARLGAARSEHQVELARKVRGRLLELARRGASLGETAAVESEDGEVAS